MPAQGKPCSLVARGPPSFGRQGLGGSASLLNRQGPAGWRPSRPWDPEPRPHVLGARRAPGPAKQEARQRRGSVGRGPGQELGRGQEQTGTGRREDPRGASPRPDQEQARL